MQGICVTMGRKYRQTRGRTHLDSELAKEIKYKKAELLRENNHGVTLYHSNSVNFFYEV